MNTDEGTQLHLFEMDKHLDTVDETLIIFSAEIKSHLEYVSMPLLGNTDVKYYISALGGYGGIRNPQWLVVSKHGKEISDPLIFRSMSEAMIHIENLTGKGVKFRADPPKVSDPNVGG